MRLCSIHHAHTAGQLGLEIMSDQPLMEAGLDSISAVELSNAISTHFSLELPATATFDYPSMDALADFIASRQPSTAVPVIADSGNAAAVLQVKSSWQAMQCIPLTLLSCDHNACVMHRAYGPYRHNCTWLL